MPPKPGGAVVAPQQAAGAPPAVVDDRQVSLIWQVVQLALLAMVVNSVIKSLPQVPQEQSQVPSVNQPPPSAFDMDSVSAILVELWDPTERIAPLVLLPNGGAKYDGRCKLNRLPVSAAVHLGADGDTIHFSKAGPCLVSQRVTPAAKTWRWEPSLELFAAELDLSAACCNASAAVPDGGSDSSDADALTTTSEVALTTDSTVAVVNGTQCHPASCLAQLKLRVTLTQADRDWITAVPRSVLIANLTVDRPRPKRRAATLLIGDEIPLSTSPDDAALALETDAELPPLITLIEENVTVALIGDPQGQERQLRPFFKDKLSSGARRFHAMHHDFWTLRRHRKLLNQTSAKNVTLRVTLNRLSMMMAAMLSQLQNGLQQQEDSGLLRSGESDGFKEILVDNSPWYLGLCFTVSMLRMVFEYLAFKNDVQFWRSKTGKDGTLQGLSLRTVAINCYFQLIVFLYLLDSEGTSFAVTLPSGVGVLIEFWKLFKCVRVARDAATGRFSIRWAKSSNDDMDETAVHDRTAVRYMTYIGAPMLLAYTVYSALYQPQTGWYSFLIATQVSAIYYAGFAVMCPQIYINYKLKSVAALPWRALVYKFLNTIVDDLFAFVIAMPTMHRIACFRDDVVFVILLAQRYQYPVDKYRVNEFGQGGEPDDGQEAAPAPAAASIAAAVGGANGRHSKPKQS